MGRLNPMRTTPFKTVLEDTCDIAGLDFADLVESQRADVLRKILRFTKKAWSWDRWFELCPTERRLYRAEFDVATAYAAPTAAAATEVFYTPAGKYYQALKLTIAGQLPATLVSGSYVVNGAYWAESSTSYSGADWLTGAAYVVGTVVRNPADGRYYDCHTAHTAGGSFDATKFGILTPFAAYVAVDQPGMTLIGEVICLSANDPDVNTAAPNYIKHRMSARGIVPLGTAPVAVWVKFRIRMPLYTFREWDSTESYSAGDIILSDSAGDCYKARLDVAGDAANDDPEDDAANWELVEFPQVLENFVKRAAAAALLKSDGQDDKAKAEETAAYAELSDDRLVQQDAQTPSGRVQAETY